jgi:hypothetical protein
MRLPPNAHHRYRQLGYVYLSVISLGHKSQNLSPEVCELMY